MKNSQEAIKKKVEDHKKHKARQEYKQYKSTTVNRRVFIKTEEEVKVIKTEKKKHNEYFREVFGTKRPTAGIVKRFFNS